MKIGILTYHNAINYGAVLQAFSTKTFLQKLGHEAEIVNYCCPAVEKQYRVETFREAANGKEFISHNISAVLRSAKKRAFQSFVNKMTVGEKITDAKQLQEYVTKFDAVIIGSDQVWNSIGNGGDAAYFTPGEQVAKIGYAVSCGSAHNLKLYEKYGVDYETAIEKFSSLAFREEELAEYVGFIRQRQYQVVVDPVFLNSREMWKNVANRRFAGEKYIFAYNLSDNELLFDALKRLSRLTKLPVYIVNKDVKGEVRSLGHYRRFSNVSVEDFLGLICDASYVVTDSFHASAFSIIFERKFYTIFDRGGANTNSRMKTLLQDTGLMTCAVIGDEENKIERSYNEYIDYMAVREKTDRKVEKSVAFLKGALDKVKNEKNRV